MAKQESVTQDMPWEPPLVALSLYQLRYKVRRNHPALDGLIEASTMAKAQEIARKWCSDHEYIYINVEDAILASERDEIEGNG